MNRISLHHGSSQVEIGKFSRGKILLFVYIALSNIMGPNLIGQGTKSVFRSELRTMDKMTGAAQVGIVQF